MSMRARQSRLSDPRRQARACVAFVLVCRAPRFDDRWPGRARRTRRRASSSASA